VPDSLLNVRYDSNLFPSDDHRTLIRLAAMFRFCLIHDSDRKKTRKRFGFCRSFAIPARVQQFW
jgi:hypothetical protein